MFQTLDFKPLSGCASPFLQMGIACYSSGGKEPFSYTQLVSLDDGDQISCHFSKPIHWQTHQSTIVLVHGAGGCHSSPYMIRLARKFYQAGFHVVRVNLRGAGSGAGFNNRNYCAENSHDLLTVLKVLKKEAPKSSITLCGFSLGGSLGMKLAGELGVNAHHYLDHLIAICPPLDYKHTTQNIRNTFCERVLLQDVLRQHHRWCKNEKIKNVSDYDEKVTVNLWGYANLNEYYDKCSPYNFVSKINIPFDLILSVDDPIVDYRTAKQMQFSSSTNVWLSRYGAHIGFIGWAGKEHGIFWLDKLLLNWKLNSTQRVTQEYN